MRTFCRACLLLAALRPGFVCAQQAADPALLRVAAAYAAKVTASALFVSGRTLDSVLDEELAPDRAIEALIRPLLQFDVDADARTVTCRLGAASATAVATGDLGCTLVFGAVTADRLRQRTSGGHADAPADPAAPDWPRGDRAAPPADGIDLAAVERAIDAAFAEPAGKPRIRTRAVVVVHRSELVAARYAAGYTAAMPLPGWSMSKTLVDALVGIRVQQGELDLAAAPDVPEWRLDPDDRRRDIRLEHLLTMTAGLAWNEDYDDPNSDALRMLLGSGDHAAEYARQPLVAEPGREYRYASGSTNLICRLLRRTFASDTDYWAFPRAALFEPLGMRSALLETDPSGTFVGSSYGFATARDWARFGQLLADDGMVGGRRLLPVGWVARSATPTPASGGRFGWHLWLNADPDGDGPRQRMWPDLPADLLHLDGHEGQYCVVMPQAQLVIVRLGCTKSGGFGLHALLRDVHAACR
ncbi:MAG: serine hydrolase [Planctomycetes bacterium]|nr:serine hydrolase [Planctomycetota bacterium]